MTFSDGINSHVNRTKHFILSYFVTGFLTLSGKVNGVQTSAGHDKREHALTNLACIFL